MPEMNPERLLTDAEVASRLGVQVQKVRDWRSMAYGPAYVRIGARVIRYRESDLEAFIERGRVDPSPPDGALVVREDEVGEPAASRSRGRAARSGGVR